MIGRIVATLAIGALLALDFAMLGTSIGRRGSEARERKEIATAVGELGGFLPDLAFVDLDGVPARLRALWRRVKVPGHVAAVLEAVKAL